MSDMVSISPEELAELKQKLSAIECCLHAAFARRPDPPHEASTRTAPSFFRVHEFSIATSRRQQWAADAQFATATPEAMREEQAK